MSAYMVDREHIDAVVELAVYGPSNRPGGLYPGGGWRSGASGLRWWWLTNSWHEARPDTADEVGAMLIAANLASIHSRYPDTADGGILPGPCAAYWDEPYVSRFVRPAPTAVEGLKLIDCFDYQACEPPGWPDSEAYAFCDALRSRLIRELDGYDAAPWGWPGKHDSPALAAGKDVSAPASTTYTLQEIRNGTGWPPAARFAVITAGVEERA